MRNLGTLLVILLAFLAAAQLRFDTWKPDTIYLVALLTGLLLASVIMPATGAFRDEFRWEFFRKLRRLLAGWSLVVMTMVALAAMLKVSADYSRIWFGTWVLFTAAGLIASQLVEHSWLLHKRRNKQFLRPIILVGGGANAARVERRIDQRKDGDLIVTARFGTAWNSKECLPLEDLGAYISENEVQEVWIAAPWDDYGILELSLEQMRELVVDIHVVPDLHQYRLLNQGISEWGGLPVINLSGTPMTGAEMWIKGAMDRLFAAIGLVLLSPLLLLIALLVKLTSPGPVFFRQPRHGVGGEDIEVFKFRTMKEHQERPGEVTQAVEDDDRFTSIGGFLRSNSLDELPQLLNVVRGEMSLVGPRPHPIQLNDDYKADIPRYMMRHKVRPGITGWAQVHGLRGITDTPDKMALRIEHDLWYIRNWSLWLDLRILMMTPVAMLHRNAV